MTAADKRPKAGTLAAEIMRFNKRVGDLVLSHGDRRPIQLIKATENGDLMRWQVYVNWLGHRSVDARQDSELWMRWNDLREGLLAERRAREREMTLMPTGELSATTVAEFTALLRKLRCGANGGVVALSKRSGISRSQIYAMTEISKPVLPTRSDQVRAFLEGCGLPEHQVIQVEQIWADLNASRAGEAAFSTERALLERLHRVVIELAGMVDQAPRQQVPASRDMVSGAVDQALVTAWLIPRWLPWSSRTPQGRCAPRRGSTDCPRNALNFGA